MCQPVVKFRDSEQLHDVRRAVSVPGPPDTPQPRNSTRARAALAQDALRGRRASDPLHRLPLRSLARSRAFSPLR